MQVIMLVIQIVIAVALIGIILLQKTSQDGGGLMGGSTTMGGLFTARGSANLLTHVTAILAALFIINSLALGILASRAHQSRSIIDQLTTTAPASTAPAVPDNSVPTTDPKPASTPAAMAPAAMTPAAMTPAKAPSPPQVPVAK